MAMKSTKDAGAILAQELNQLTLKEREELLYDIHGVLELPKEEPDFVASCLQQMDKEISTYSHNDDKKAYELAHAQNDSYVSSERLRLKFLRADNFNPRLAAQRVIRFFASKLQLFGPDYLTRDIRLDDLSEDDNNCIESGLVQVLPLRDRSGRAVICWMAAIPGSTMTRVSPSYIVHFVCDCLHKSCL
jgi:hypothetical protein